MNPASLALTNKSTIRDAVKNMQETETSGMPIISDTGAVLGLLSDGDILKNLGRHENSRFDGEEYLCWSKMLKRHFACCPKSALRRFLFCMKVNMLAV